MNVPVKKADKYSLQAKTLKDAMKNLNEQTSLVFEEKAGAPDSASSIFYVDRPDNPMEELKTLLLNSPGYDKILFTGHMGCGKSTELNRFAVDRDVLERFFVIKYSISKVLNIIDIDYIDFLLSFAAFLYIKASDEGIKFSGNVMKILEKWMDYFKADVEVLGEETKEAGKGKKILGFFKRVSVILLRELTLRDKVRETIRRNINGLVTVINALVTNIHSQLPDRELLVIIDDLEKIPDISKAEELFIKAGNYMAVPECKIIYTVPIAFHYSIKFKQLMSIFGDSYFLPNVKVRRKDGTGKLDPSGCMTEFLKRRINIGCVDKEAADMMIENSAGVAREFVRILKTACIKALSKGNDRIDVETVKKVIASLTNEFERGLEKRHIEVLKKMDKGEPVDDENTLMELYHSKALLEYLNDKRWTAVNPLVKPLLK